MGNQTEGPNFLHMDGAWKAQSDRMTVITIIAAIVALVAVAGMIAVWPQLPTGARDLLGGDDTPDILLRIYTWSQQTISGI
ncbi:MAG: hypothetical protein ACP5EP_09635 [Acidobacteriaceae bacterium]